MFHSDTIDFGTRGRGMYELTDRVQQVVRSSGIARGLCTVFVHHTSASLVINENADPDVQRDLEAFMARLVPDGDALFAHVAEGPDDMPAHVRSALTQTSLGIPVAHGRCDLGTWQGVYLWEHRNVPHQRRITVSIIGEQG
jgi:secondary thiamine-phosphate synthase enzyme